MITSIRYVLLCALRDRLFTGLALAIVLATILASALGSTSMLEEREMSLAFAAASCRMMLAVGLIVFVCFHIRAAFESREIDVMLSRPISRAQLALAYWLGFAAVAAGLVFIAVLALALIGPISMSGFAHYVGSLLLEMWMLVAFALFAALTLRSAVAAVMASLGFYVMSRMMAFFVMSADSPAVREGVYAVCAYVLKVVALLSPRLDFFANTDWLIYGLDAARDWQLYALQAAIFVPLLVAACVIDFRRKQF